MSVPSLDESSESAKPGYAMNEVEVSLRHVEYRDWQQWGVAILVTSLLTGGLSFATLPRLSSVHDPETELNLRYNIQLLSELVVLFDIYTIFHQLQMSP